MYTLGWTDNSGSELFTFGWVDGVLSFIAQGSYASVNEQGFAGQILFGSILQGAASEVGIKGFSGVFVTTLPRENVFKLSRILNASGRSTVHSNPAIARIAERLKRGPGGPRFH